MSGSRLDQIVKGAAPPGTSMPSPRSSSPSPFVVSANSQTLVVESQTSDPLTHLPSSPPQIYLNMLILEASLRSQYLTLRARRRQNTFFLSLLSLWTAYFFYALFLHPREDGSGIGGSVYWVIEMAEKVALMGGVVTGILIWGTGQWERGVKWPRRYIGLANRGLRTINCKVVVIKGPWLKEVLGHLAFVFPYSSFFPSQGSSYHYVDASTERTNHNIVKHGHDDEIDYVREEDLAPGGDHIKLLLLPKPFSPDFRENWELYRTEYWEKENERRAVLLRRLRAQERQRAKEENGWLWWTGLRRWKRMKGPGPRESDLEKTHQRHHLEKEEKLRQSTRRSESHPRTASRSSTPSNPEGEERPSLGRLRRGSGSSGSTNEGRRRPRVSSSHLSGPQMSKLTSMTDQSGSLSGLGPSKKGASSVETSSGNDSDPSLDAERNTHSMKAKAQREVSA